MYEPCWLKWKKKKTKMNFCWRCRRGFLIRRSGLTLVSPSLDIYSVTTAIINSNKLSIPIWISGSEAVLYTPPPSPPESAGLTGIQRNWPDSRNVTYCHMVVPPESAWVRWNKLNKVDCSPEKGVCQSPPESTGLYSAGKSLESTGMGINSRI